MFGLALHRLAVAVALGTLAMVVAGASISSRPIAPTHPVVGAILGLLTLALVAGLWKTPAFRWARLVGFAALIALMAQGLLGALSAFNSLPPAFAVLHACLAQLLFASTVAIALLTSAAWRAESDPLEDGGVPSLRTLAWITPLAFLAQISLGAAYRHELLGAMPHVVWALGAALIAIMTGSFVLSQFPGNLPLRRAAIVLITLTSAQIVLGVTALWARLSIAGKPGSGGFLPLIPLAHIACGALVFASSIVLSLWILRDVRTVRGLTPRPGSEFAGSGRAS